MLFTDYHPAVALCSLDGLVVIDETLNRQRTSSWRMPVTVKSAESFAKEEECVRERCFQFGGWESGDERDGIDAANAVGTAIGAIQGMPDLPDGSRPYGLEDPRT